MAAFLVRSFEIAASNVDWFVDDSTSVFAADINALAAAGITVGCNPPVGDRFCPNQPVTRDQMATFLSRAQGSLPPPLATRLVAAGDIARCELTSDDDTAHLLDMGFANRNVVVAALGDTAYNSGTPQEFADCTTPVPKRNPGSPAR